MESKLLMHIDETKWLNELDHCPQTIDQYNFLINLLDDMNLFGNRKMTTVSKMKGDYIDAIYLIARASHLMFSELIEKVANKLIPIYQRMFSVGDDDYVTDQITQDVMYSLESIMKSKKHHNLMNINTILKNYVHTLVKSDIYFNDPATTPNADRFVKDNHTTITRMSDIILMSISSFQDQMTFFSGLLDDIFNVNNYDFVAKKIQLMEDNNIIGNIMATDINVIGVYYDYVLNYDFLGNTTERLGQLGYIIKKAKKSSNCTKMMISPFIISEVIKKNKMTKVISTVLMTYGNKDLFTDLPGIKIKDFYEAMHGCSYDSFVKFFCLASKFDDNTKAIFVYRLLSTMFGINMVIFDKDMNDIRIKQDTSAYPTENIIMIQIDGYLDDKIKDIKTVNTLEYSDKQVCKLNKFSRSSLVIDFIDKRIKRKNILFEM